MIGLKCNVGEKIGLHFGEVTSRCIIDFNTAKDTIAS